MREGSFFLFHIRIQGIPCYDPPAAIQEFLDRIVVDSPRIANMKAMALSMLILQGMDTP